MWLRRGFFRWLYPAAIVLPAWMLIGWAIFNAGGWTFLGVLLIAAPAVLVGELIITLLIRARPTVRAERAVSWWDVLGVTVWHGLVIAFGCFIEPVFLAILLAAVVAFLVIFWSSLRQLWGEARGSIRRGWAGTGPADLPTDAPTDADVRDRARQHAEVIVVNEVGRPGDGRNVH
ncbi:MFS transporter permease [Microbacterium protaetiae]|uniref:MFS transporter permease n=1 Tax=Microbacterium protaetiae TaxID=2509458 RepID=A0A4P6EHY8_9MICO|nr:MFS transporter permease [Microbacterium protaetiae]QAY61153.1 MFS transporter permease [Microbacterium protaetiae]